MLLLYQATAQAVAFLMGIFCVLLQVALLQCIPVLFTHQMLAGLE